MKQKIGNGVDSFVEGFLSFSPDIGIRIIKTLLIGVFLNTVLNFIPYTSGNVALIFSFAISVLVFVDYKHKFTPAIILGSINAGITFVASGGEPISSSTVFILTILVDMQNRKTIETKIDEYFKKRKKFSRKEGREKTVA